MLLVLVSCGPTNEQSNKASTKAISQDTLTEPKVIVPDRPQASPTYLKYAFFNGAVKDRLIDKVSPPDGYKRINVASQSFAEWLRFLPVKAEGVPVKLYDGGLKSNQEVHYAILDIDVGKRDLQQCADAVMRLYAEYHYSKAAYSEIHFNFTSGDLVSFDDWSKGRKPIVAGNEVSFSNPDGAKDISYSNFKKYLQVIFNYAGTASLSKELTSVEVKDMQIGDVFIQGGFPGHAVIVMDMAENEAGEKLFLLAQSYMPAQDIHILKNIGDPMDPWYSLDFGSHLVTPEWQFEDGDLKRF